MGEVFSNLKLGWLPDFPDCRDHTPTYQPTTDTPLAKVSVAKPQGAPVPTSSDLRQWCSPVEDQEQIGSCTAHAGVGLVEYFENRAFGKHLDASRLFLYKVTRNLMRQTGDTGAFLRTTMKALVCFGVPPEEYWRYHTPVFDEEPPAFCYAFAQNYRTIEYYRLDPPGTMRGELLDRIRVNLGAGLPSMLGFTVYSSIRQANDSGKIPFPSSQERVEGGHAVVAVGHDDNMKITNTAAGGRETTGALLIRNSWGPGWGERGYGWLPYEYVLQGLAQDWWSLLKNDWVDTGKFDLTTR